MAMSGNPAGGVLQRAVLQGVLVPLRARAQAGWDVSSGRRGAGFWGVVHVVVVHSMGIKGVGMGLQRDAKNART